ncbi:MAG: hypothetical protein HWE26_13820 [Alteromonadaceae bacterium]|nr:hypothetical protein [Alteromonadaceae bacterium]
MNLPHDWKVRTVPELIDLFESGKFADKLVKGHSDLLEAINHHLAEYGPTGCSGKITITLTYKAEADRGVELTATAAYLHPSPPAEKGKSLAFIDREGQLTLENPALTAGEYD